MMPPVRALVVSYAFPPVGGAGVQRVLKLVKYLPAHGVRPAVLTVENPSTPLRDASLERDVPSGLDVVRARTLEPGYSIKQHAWNAAASGSGTPGAQVRKRLVDLGRRLLIPDPQVLWLPGSAVALARRLRSVDAEDVIFISGPPFSQFLLSAVVQLKRGTAVVLDYRDEWTMTGGAYEMGGGARTSAWLERALLARAHAVTTATEEFRSELLRRFAFLDPGRVHAIPNGYDPDDFPEKLPEPPADRFVLTYVGTVFRLTSARGLIEGIRRLRERDPELARLLEVRFIGRIVETEAAYFEGTEALGVSRRGYVEHRDAVVELAASHAVLCILANVDGAERICPAKIYEIMYLGRPCVALAPDGALARVVRRHRLGDVVGPGDADAIAAVLAGRLRGFREGSAANVRQAATPPLDIGRFHRERLAGEFAAVFRQAVALAQASVQFPRRADPVSAAVAK